MSNDKLRLRGTELLLIQKLMRGENSGLDFEQFRESGVNKARYRGDRSEDLYDSQVLEPAKEDGRITQVRFYVDYNDGTGERPIQVQVYDDGHVNTTQPSEEDLLNEIEKRLVDVLSYRDFLTPFEDLLNDFVPLKFRSSLHSPEGNYRSKSRAAFQRLVKDYFSNYEEEEITLYQSVIANIGIQLIGLDLSQSQYPDVADNDDYPRGEGRVKDFFESYAQHELGRTGCDFDELWNHLHHIMSGDWDTPIEAIEYAVLEYDIEE